MDVKVLVAALALVAVLPAGTSARTRHTSVGTTHVFAPVPYPGHPGGIAVDGRTVYVDTFNPIDRAGDDYDAIFTYDLNTGRLRADRPNPIKVPRVMSPTVMGLAAIALDAQGRLYVDDMNGRVIRVNPLTGAQTNYGTFPTSSSTSLTAMPDGLAFDRAGNLYVTDGSSPTIWRVPPGGGEAQRWLVDPALPSAWESGLDGAAIDPSERYLYFTEGYGQACSVYRVPLDRPEIGSVELIHLFAPGPVAVDPDRQEFHGVFGPCAMAFGRNGSMYVTLMGSNQVSVLRPDGSEAYRFPADGAPRDPYDDPLFGAFDGDGSFLVTNLAATNPRYSAVLEAWVADKGLPLIRPVIPGA